MEPKKQLPALTGIRFIAIFHIFLHHLWALHTYVRDTKPGTEGLLKDMADLPDSLMLFFANGWVSTSLFFMLSGFMLGHLYWQRDGSFLGTPQRFLILRFSRLYPAHLVVLSLLIVNAFNVHIEDGFSIEFIVASAIGTALLVQAWFSSWVPMWNWPAWTISVLVFLYLVMPILAKWLGRLSSSHQKFLLLTLPLISLLPTAVYAWLLWRGMPWNMNTEIFFNNFPLFWLPYFVAGMLLTRLINSEEPEKTYNVYSVSIGDLAFVAALSFTFIPDLLQPLTSVIRFGVLMPLYMLFIIDLAKGKGIIARLISGRVLNYLGEISFSIFIWQAAVIAALVNSVSVYPAIVDYHLPVAIISILLVSIASFHWLERPIYNYVKRKLNRNLPLNNSA
ncbi:acyltransferase [Alteromonas sp. ASW11-36]|uniref:Acyltransferase n=1 Tax=Alteromonas arenosi TaxID=3055817 RepID=A0ABT7SZA1_9ALTE|nr:acyltransferase [Alteromonas sp. ASW11-36]MDM7861516.1 acyltransferase [Alteromonas sp. ASW11-36]